MDARLEAVCDSPASFPAAGPPEVAVAGRSNCGKSSLINALTGRTRLARTSSTPGRTRQIVFFRLAQRQTDPLYLVDLPGYGYAKTSKSQRGAWARLVGQYIDERPTLCALLLLQDCRRAPRQEERDLLQWARHRGLETVVVLTKADKLAKSKRFAAAESARRELGLRRRPPLLSIHDRAAVAALREQLLQRVASARPPRESGVDGTT